jgi:DNA-binding CsgD family transcriptional regulator
MLYSIRRIIFLNAFITLKAALLFLVVMVARLPELQGQATITGRIGLDTTRWAPMAYLSIIPDFTQLYTISNESIIQRTAIDQQGNFRFDCQSLPAADHLYRIHFSKKGDPSASLIIGGQEENHLFLIANNQSDIGILVREGRSLTSRISFSGYALNKELQEINQIAGFLDTLDFYGPAVNRDFVRQAVYDKLRQYADTCQDPLISLYALYHSRFESDYPQNTSFYQKYLHKWRKENSEYFRAFRAQLPVKEPRNILIPILIFSVLLISGLGVIRYFLVRKKRSKNPYQSLTVQERKIFGLMKDGRSNKEISDECGISLSTVKSHVNSIYSKLDISSRTDVMDYSTNTP